MSIVVDRGVEFVDTIQRIAIDVAAVNADDVDRQARFPHETISALRDAG